MDSESKLADWGKTKPSQLYLSRISLAKPVKLNFFKTPASIELIFLFQFPFIVYDICVSSNYMQFLLDS